MSLFIFLTVVQALVAAALVGVILIQRSEGGGLGIGGGSGPGGLLSARGAANFLTRMTTILAIAFVALSIALAALAVGAGSTREIDASLDRSVVPAEETAIPDPLADPSTATAPAAATTPAAPADPLAGVAE